MQELQTRVLCEGCGYDLRGSPQRGRCPECNIEYDQQALLAEQDRSQRPMPRGLKIVGVLSAIYFGLAVMVIVAEDFLHIRRIPLENLVIPTLFMGGPILIILLCITVGGVRYGQPPGRPFYDTIRWKLLPNGVRFWILFDLATLFLGFFLIWGNPFWKILLRTIKRVIP